MRQNVKRHFVEIEPGVPVIIDDGKTENFVILGARGKRLLPVFFQKRIYRFHADFDVVNNSAVPIPKNNVVFHKVNNIL